MKDLIKEYKPALLFLARFLGVYIIGNIIYGIWIASFNQADPVTQMVSDHTVVLLNWLGYDVSAILATDRPTTILYLGETSFLEIFEGCNAINVSILFVSFLVAYKGPLLNTVIFGLVGLIAIYVFNLMRLVGLFYVVIYIPNYMYFLHKFAFTGVIYAFVFGLWYLWVKRFSMSNTNK